MAKKDMSQPNLSIVLSAATQIGNDYLCTNVAKPKHPRNVSGINTASNRRRIYD